MTTTEQGAAGPGEGPPAEFGRFFLPGPTEVRPEILRAQVRAIIGHRGPHISGLVNRLQPGLRSLFGTRRPVLISTSSATGLMEAGIRCGVRRRLLALVNGAFSGRFAKIARACDLEVETLEVPWGDVHDPAAVAERFAEAGADGRPFDAVSLVHSETSTGALEPVAEIARAVRAAPGGGVGEAMIVVDSVTGIGGVPVETDRWSLDFVLTGSQKALALPPGLAFGVASPAMLERAREVRGKGVYFDLNAFYSRLERLQTPNTPAVSLLYALEAQLAAIEREGLENRFARHRAMAERTAAWVRSVREERGVELGFTAVEGGRSPTVTSVDLPPGVGGADVVAAARERGWVIGGGYGKLKPTAFRIGHMGDHTLEELKELLGVLDEVLVELAGPVAARSADTKGGVV